MGLRIIAALAAIAVPLMGIAADLNVFQPGDPISASEINQNFSELESRIQSNQSSKKLEVFSSSDVALGSAGRVTMNSMCAATDPEATFCSEGRLTAAANSTGITWGSITDISWVDSNIMSNSASFNCEGWNSSAMTGYALSQTGRSLQATCTIARPVLCCK
jgi:opacity protein-like surface antigen